MTSASADEVAEIVPELVEEEQGVLELEDADLLDGVEDEPATANTAEAGSDAGSGVLAGAAAVAAAGLGLVSLSGSWLGNVLAQRQTLIGQLTTANANADVIIKQRYTEPWHRTAFVSMGFAVAAIAVAAATLFLGHFVARVQAPVWVRALAWGALAIGVVGLGVSAAMYFDVFAGTITVPAGS
jgi:hypothetical protein